MATERSTFAAPDWDEPLHGERLLAAVPDDARSMGWLLAAVVTQTSARGLELERAERFIPVKDYPTRQLVELLLRASRELAPEQPARLNLWELGRACYDSIASSLLGQILLEALQRDRDEPDVLQANLRLLGRVYAWASLGRSTLQVVELGKSWAQLRLDDVWSFPDCFHVGLLSRLGEPLELELRVSIAQHSEPLGSLTLLMEWAPRASLAAKSASR